MLQYGSLGRDWNYTHNTNPMIERALGSRTDGTPKPWWARINPDSQMGRFSWWELLDGCSGADGADLLDGVLASFEANPDKYRKLNPDNGWGNFDQLREVLREMRDASRDCPEAIWTASG